MQASYLLGHDVIAQLRAAATSLEYMLYDGHGSNRGLVDAMGLPVSSSGSQQIFAYDAYGNQIVGNGLVTASAALTTYLHSGEQFDVSTGNYYNRRRFYNPATGRFNRVDPYSGSINDPQSLHKYLFTHGDPVNGIDPTGLFSASEALSVISNIGNMISNFAQPAIRAFQVVQRVQSLIELFQLLRGLDSLSSVLRREVAKILKETSTGGAFRNLSLADVGFTFEQFARDLTLEIAPTIARKHTKRIGEAAVSRTSNKSRRHQLVLYLPNVSGRFRIDTRLIPLGIKIAGFPVTLSTGGGGGRLWGFGFAKSKRELKQRANSYMLFRTDWHNSEFKHRTPFAKYFNAPSEKQYHWHIPESANEARGIKIF